LAIWSGYDVGRGYSALPRAEYVSLIEQAAVADLGSDVERDRLHEWFSFIERQHEALSKDPMTSASERRLRRQLVEDWDELARR
jgi:hypothetical protein